MTGVLPQGWQVSDVQARPGGCWRWVGVQLSWEAARTLIEADAGVPRGRRCAVTPGCVHPLHDESSLPPAGGSA